MKIEMEKVIVTSINTGGSGGEDRFTENVSLNFAKFKMTYTPQKEDGSADARSVRSAGTSPPTSSSEGVAGALGGRMARAPAPSGGWLALVSRDRMMASIVEQAIREGELDKALAAVQERCAPQPAKAEQRVSLFQLLALAGEWAKALRQLNVLSDLDPKMELLAATYRQLIACEGVRGEVFEGKRAPLCLGDPPDWYARLVEALRFDGSGHHAAAKELRDQAFAAAQPSTGRIGDDTSPGWPMLTSAWDRSSRPSWALLLDPVRAGASASRSTSSDDLRDVVWLSAERTLGDTGRGCRDSSRRATRGSKRSPDDAIRLARRTEWQQLGDRQLDRARPAHAGD